MLSLFQNLLPRARAWNTTADKWLRRFIDGLSDIVTGVQSHFDLIWYDIFPATTREIDAWEETFGLIYNKTLTEQERRDALAAAWAQTGGQSPSYIQNQLQAAGFDVYIHDWWATISPVTPNNPFAAGGAYPLVNLYVGNNTIFDPPECIDPSTPGVLATDVPECTNEADMGISSGDVFECQPLGVIAGGPKTYNFPTDPDKWPYIIYIAGATFGTPANIPAERRLEFESLCLKICPAHLWLGITVNYT